MMSFDEFLKESGVHTDEDEENDGCCYDDQEQKHDIKTPTDFRSSSYMHCPNPITILTVYLFPFHL